MPSSALGSGNPGGKGNVTAQVQPAPRKWTITKDPINAITVTMAE